MYCELKWTECIKASMCGECLTSIYCMYQTNMNPMLYKVKA